ncbi:MAG: c-type cytochrome [Opitutae bacterium]|nr:c-type cytochrome [Opitutae bacterium]
MNPQPPADDRDEALRPHSYDGIHEYDKRLPNWWLYTLYGTIAFWVFYWFANQIAHIVPSDTAQVDAAMAKINAVKMANSIDVTNDAKFWEMSQNSEFVNSGKQTFDSLCVQCHLPSMKGKSENPTAVGPNLVDTAWIHGGTPKEVYATVSKGVLAKGMPTWEPVLGQKKVVEVVSYVLSRHKQGEEVTVEVSK